MTSYGFHPDALMDHEDATRYYLEQASPMVAAAFVAAVESAIQAVCASPMTWRAVDELGVRRCLLRRFPYALYYRWDCRRSVENQPVVVELKPATSLVLNASELIWQERILNGVS